MSPEMKTLSHEVVFENKWIRLNKDDVEFFDGSKGVYAFMDRVDNGAMVIPMTDDGKIIMIKEWRYPIKNFTWCFPAGGKEENEESLVAAKRESLEEIGANAIEWIDLGNVAIDPGASSQVLPVYLAKGLSFVKTRQDSGENIKAHEMPLDKIIDLVKSGEINNGWALACLMKLFVYLNKV